MGFSSFPNKNEVSVKRWVFDCTSNKLKGIRYQVKGKILNFGEKFPVALPIELRGQTRAW